MRADRFSFHNLGNHAVRLAVLLLVVYLFEPFAAHAMQTTNSTGNGQSFTNLQPSLAVNYFVPLQGVYPSRNGGPAGEMTLASVRMFAGTFTPGGANPAEGQLLPIAQNTALFSLLGTSVCEKFFWRDGNPLFIVTCVTSI